MLLIGGFTPPEVYFYTSYLLELSTMMWLNKVPLPNVAKTLQSLWTVLPSLLPESFRVKMRVWVLRLRGGPATPLTSKWEQVPYDFEINWYQSDTSEGLSPEDKETGGFK
jgi:hypothetical protein